MRADLMMDGDQRGWADLRKAPARATCGQAMEVPDLMENDEGFLPAGTSYMFMGGIAARMLTPGAIRSGLRMASVRAAGPRAEKDATTGAGLNNLTSFVGRIAAVGFLKHR